MATKIKRILSATPHGSLLFSSWLTLQGIDRKEQTLYVRSGWLDRLSQGVYKIDGSTVNLYSAISSYNTQLRKQCHVGASSALDIRGYSHFVPMGKPQAYLFTTRQHRLPSWLVNYDWDMIVKYFTSSVLPEEMGIDEIDYQGYKLFVSSPERAFMECLHLAPSNFAYLDIYYVMEMLTTLRPKLVQQLLENCSSVKVKRVFLYMAEKAGHQWLKALDLTKIDLGSGKRLLAERGKYISKYQITIPTELADYE